ncbi:MAG: AI-2E family transporter [Clostridia bacterium]|nr:AI-2E family transporter [Clostridia bacterium]
MELSKTAWRRLLLLVVLTLLGAFGLRHIDSVWAWISAALSIVSPIFFGICIAFVVNIPMRPLERLWDRLLLRGGGKGGIGERLLCSLRRPCCLILSLLFLCGLLCAVTFLLIPQLTSAFTDFAAMLPGYLERLEGLWARAQIWLAEFGVALPDFSIDTSELRASAILAAVKRFLTQWGMHILDTTVSITTTVFSGVFNTVLSFVFSIYMLAQKEMLCRQVHRCFSAFLPRRRMDWLAHLMQLINRSFTNFITGQFAEAVVIGVLCGIGMAILRIPYAFAVSVVVGFTALIPVFGAYVGTALGACLILLAEPIKAVWFVLFIIVLQQIEGNLIYPRVVGKSVGLPGVLVLAAVTVGSGIGGLPGMLLAVPVTSVLFTLCAEAVDARLTEREAQPEAEAAVLSPEVAAAPVPGAEEVRPAAASTGIPARAPQKKSKKKAKQKR